ncbi:MAG: hypothetical protein ACODAE_09235 [Gemmatimonadota bacterium]
MTRTRVRIRGDTTEGMGGEILSSMRGDADRAVDQVTDALEREIKSKLRETGQGAEAAEGEPPAIRSGDLIRSVRREPLRTTAGLHGYTVRSAVIVDDPGAARVEFGGRDARGIVTVPHPFYLPAVKVVTAKARAIFERVGRR